MFTAVTSSRLKEFGPNHVVLSAVVIFLTVMAPPMHCVQSPEDLPPACTVFCSGDIIEAVDLHQIYNDSKTFVDLPMKVDPNVILSEWGKLGPQPNETVIRAFLQTYFGPVGSDIESWSPTDWVSDPEFLGKIGNETWRQFGSDLHGLWNVLGKQTVQDVVDNPQRHSLLPLSHGAIVPGGRFREVYYWDTFWIIKGLLVSGMTTTAKGMISNLLEFVEKFGFVPNGGRVYYLNRSQPPLLSLMVAEYLAHTEDEDFRKQSLPILTREYDYWMRTDGPENSTSPVNITLHGATTPVYQLNRFTVTTQVHPRPESWREDHALSLENKNVPPNSLFTELTAGAETGWDFSSRWLTDANNLATIRTSDVVPVDLNSILYKVEQLLSKWYSAEGDTTRGGVYEAAAQRRGTAMSEVMWNEEQGQWYDYHLRPGRQGARSDQHYPSNFVPLWAGLADGNHSRMLKIGQAISSSPLLGVGGFSTSTVRSKQQWDFPDAWPPCQWFIIRGLYESGVDELQDQSQSLAKMWLMTNLVAFIRTKQMHEKYDSRQVGGIAGGGEYVPQIGFGWTNGVALDFLATYGGVLDVPDRKEPFHLSGVALFFILASSAALFIAGVACLYRKTGKTWSVRRGRHWQRRTANGQDTDGQILRTGARMEEGGI